MARRRGKKRRKSKASIPLAVVGPVLTVALLDFSKAAPEGISGKANRFLESVTGYNVIAKSYDYKAALPLWLGTAAGVVVHKVANKTGINKHIRALSMGWLSL